MSRSRRRGSLFSNAIRGAIAGAVATSMMDLVTTTLLESQGEEATAQERAAQPNGKSSVANLLDRIEAVYGLNLTEDQRATALQAIHYGLGVGPGAMYGALRGVVPVIGRGGGLVYGFLLWAINDEYMNTALGLAGPFEAYPLETHWRGLVGHLVLGVATDTGIDVLGG